MTFNEYLHRVGVSRAVHERSSFCEADLVDQPAEDAIKLALSPIDGLGIIATKDFAPGEKIALAITKDLFRTERAGRFVNHADKPNARTKVDPVDTQLYIVARKRICAGEEITICYWKNQGEVARLMHALGERIEG